MGGSTHRIELLLVGLVLLGGAALAAAAPLIPIAPVAPAPPPAAAQAPPPEDRWGAALAAAAQLTAIARSGLRAVPPEAVGAAALAALAALAGGLALRIVRGVARPLPGFSHRAPAPHPNRRALRWPRVPRGIHTIRTLLARARTLRLPSLPRRLAPTPSLDLGPVAPFILDIEEPPVAGAGVRSQESNVRGGKAAVGSLEPPSAPPKPPDHASADDRPAAGNPRVHAVAAALARIWRDLDLHSPVIGLDLEEGTGEVLALLDANPADEGRLLAIPECLAREHPAWGARWRAGALAITVPSPPAGLLAAPPVVPVLRHGRGGRVGRYLPLGWPGDAAGGCLGLYGAAAADLLHTCVVEMLYAHPPDRLALAVLGDPLAVSIYAAAPHSVPLPGDSPVTCEAIDWALRRGWVGDIRPLLLVAAEPDATTLAALDALLARLRRRPGAPVYVLVAQRRLNPEGRELYARTPALVTWGGEGEHRWLPGGRPWPARGRARLVTALGCTEGAPALTADTDAVAAVAALPPPGVLPPTLLGPASGARGPEARSAGIIPDADASRCQPAASEPPPCDPLVDRLARVLDPARAAEGAPPTCDLRLDTLQSEGPWPAGPAGMPPARVESLIEQLLSAPEIHAARPPGLTKGRLAALLPPEERHAADALMRWLDAAGVLADPRSESVRWREPRLIHSADPGWIAERLRAATREGDG